MRGWADSGSAAKVVGNGDGLAGLDERPLGLAGDFTLLEVGLNT